MPIQVKIQNSISSFATIRLNYLRCGQHFLGYLSAAALWREREKVKEKIIQFISKILLDGFRGLRKHTLTLSMIVKISDTCVALDNFVVRHMQLKIVTNTKTTIFREPPQILSQIRIID